MKINIQFNRDEWETGINKTTLLSVKDVQINDDGEYFIEPQTLEEFDTILSKIEKYFDYRVDIIASADRLELFLDFNSLR